MALLTPTSHSPSCSLKEVSATFANIYCWKFSISPLLFLNLFLIETNKYFPGKTESTNEDFLYYKTFTLYIFYSGVCAIEPRTSEI